MFVGWMEQYGGGDSFAGAAGGMDFGAFDIGERRGGRGREFERRLD
jgi:hypothetical protein